MRSSYKRKDDKGSLGHVNVEMFVEHQNEGSGSNLEYRKEGLEIG